MINKYHRVHVVGGFGEENFGDDLLLLATNRLLLKKIHPEKIGVCVIDPRGGNYLQSWIDRGHVIESPYLVPRRCDLQIYAGGTQFYSFPIEGVEDEPRPFFSRLVYKIKQRGLLRLLVHQVLKRVIKKPFSIAVGIGVGPFESGNEDNAKRVLASMDRVWVRDVLSYSHLEKWGIEHFSRGADLCFAENAVDFPEKKIESGGVHYVGIVVRGWPYRTSAHNYETGLLDLARWIRSLGYAVTFFAFCAPADQKVIDYLRSKGELVDVWNPRVEQVQSYVARISVQDVLISSRYHGVVVASILGIPSVGLALDPKVSLICDRLGLAEYIWEAPFSPEQLRVNFLSLVSKYLMVKKELIVRMRREQVIADSMIREVLMYLDVNDEL
jgi:polysaccharide pyruvyl transferase WcaK-like protein